jgi:hypothetical protein
MNISRRWVVAGSTLFVTFLALGLIYLHAADAGSALTLDNPKVLARCDRNLLARMKALDEATLQKEFAPHVSRDEIRGLLARRDIIVKFFEAKGDSALFDRPARL